VLDVHRLQTYGLNLTPFNPLKLSQFFFYMFPRLMTSDEKSVYP
jgi:hypothetical protein